MSFHNQATLVAAAIALPVLVTATAASAQSQRVTVTAPSVADRPTKIVSYRDLNLAAAHDQRRLDRRVGSAVEEVCQIDDYHMIRALASHTRYFACSDYAWKDARPQIAAAIDRAKVLASSGGIAVGSMAITVSARASE